MIDTESIVLASTTDPYIDTSLILGQPIATVNDHLGEPDAINENEYRLLHFYRNIKVQFHDGVSVFARFEAKHLKTGRLRRALGMLNLPMPTKKPKLLWGGKARQWEPFGPFGRLTAYYNGGGHVEAITIATKEALEEMRKELGGENAKDTD